MDWACVFCADRLAELYIVLFEVNLAVSILCYSIVVCVLHCEGLTCPAVCTFY
jgi:hypothetical protein